MPMPLSIMVAPAIMWVYLSSLPSFRKLSPVEAIRTRTSMVSMVTSPNTKDTCIIPQVLAWAAGYIRMGMSGSQGPRKNITNRIQGVMLFRWL